MTALAAGAAALSIALTIGAPATVDIAWILPNGGTSSNVTWPQPVASDENLAALPCGTTVTLQIDTYPYGTYEEKARTDALAADGFLSAGEDHGWVRSWRYEEYSTPACEPEPEPTPTPTPEPTPSGEPTPTPTPTVPAVPQPPKPEVPSSGTPGAGVPNPPAPGLAESGSDSLPTILWALGILGLGAGLFAWSRKAERS
ncbi:hypothetical protein [Microbacterium sp.]|uniref:hypothetical protein n=1 Tax=Microbacterium sp. TaxID=51671 RepID=UPI003F6E58C6